MRYPVFLSDHGTIGFPAPSFGCASEPYKSAFAHALEVFKEKGHAVMPGPNAWKGEGIGISSTPAACGQEINDMFASKDVDVLISCGGGELMCEDLDYIDFKKLGQSEPKWYMGYSDNTNLTFLLPTLCDTAAIYGPCAGAFGMDPWHPAIEDAYQLLRGEKLTVANYGTYEKESLKDEEHPLEPYHTTEKQEIRAYIGREHISGETSVSMSGRLIGGCMDCLVNLTGTKYDKAAAFCEKYKDDGIIWFLEACDLNVFAIRRAVWQMQHAGWFSHVSGFLIGRPLCHGQSFMGLDQYKAVVDLLGEYQVPILMDLDIGHVAPMMPLISGAMANVTYQPGAEKKVTVEMRRC